MPADRPTLHLTRPQLALLTAMGLDGPAAITAEGVSVDALTWPAAVADGLVAVGYARRLIHGDCYILTYTGKARYERWRARVQANRRSRV